MTKTIITIYIIIYSLVRLVSIGLLYLDKLMRLPTSVVVTTIVCSILCLIIAVNCYLRNLSGKRLRFALLIGAVAACINMFITLLAQPGTLTTQELIVTGTFFDPLLFLGCCTIKIRDTKGLLGRTPFSRVAVQAGKQNRSS